MVLGGLMLATALWSGVQALNAEARASYAASSAALGQGSLDLLSHPDGTPVTQADFIALRRAGYPVSPVIEGTLPGRDGPVRLLGLDPLTSPPRPELAGLADGQIDLATFLTAPGLLLAAPETAALLPPALPPIRTLATLPADVIVTDVTTAARLLDRTGFDHLVLDRPLPLGLPPIGTVTDLHLTREAPSGDIAALTNSFHLNLTAFGLLSFAVGLFIVQSAIGLAFEQRRGTVRSLRAMGVSLRRVMIAIVMELSLFAVLAGAAGLALGYLLARALMPGVSGTLRALYGAQIDAAIGFDPLWAATGLAMTLAGALLAAAAALWRVGRMPLLAAGSASWARQASIGLRWQTLAALALFALASVLAVVGDSLVAGFACIAALLIGAALMLPPLVSALLWLASRAVPPGIPQWVLADTRQQVPGLSLALMALLLALSANVGVSTMVGSFRTTFIGWLDQRLAADLYLTARTADEARDIRAHLQTVTDVTTVIPIWSVPAMLDGQPGSAYGIIDDPLYRDHWPLLAARPDVWDALHRGEGVLVNEQLFRRSGLSLDDPVQVVDGWEAPVLGVYSDYGNTRPQVMADAAALAARIDPPPILRFALRVAPGTQAEVKSNIQTLFSLPETNIVDQARVKEFSLSVFERTFLVTGALNVLTLAVAGFALFMSLLTLSDLRLPQVAPVWAQGMPVRLLARLDITRSVALALVTFVVSIPVGLALAWVLLAVVNVQAFGWRLPMSVFPADWARLAGWAVLATVLASLWPALRLSSSGPVLLLRVFAAHG
ncbi:ABC transporter permease [Pseudaestuariivita atlantica]|uniref:ABC transporter permease n=2 Tax=Pseudaestuariivita atlantica TaxID=1317121 RepID=A0A0L1JKD4_9RHOB|nr:FtsX-like permease family protein [Pseudaestuariivita atlantica]KNG92182.1 ABC transporter permease [Pseudaestuariivita atlantica]